MIKKNFMAIDKEKPLVSIFCLTYNHAPYIRQCLDGFLMQKATFTYEVIINDDASTDGTTEIIREYEEKYPDIIKPIYHEENLYSKGERGFWQKYCFPKSKGKYIALCEGDDYWIDPLKLQKQVDFLEKHPEYVLVYTNAEKVNSKSKRVLRNSLKGYSGNITKYLFYKGNPVITATTCFRRQYLLEYQEEIKQIPFKMKMGDLPLWIYLSLQGKFKYLNDRTTAYRVLQESASHSKSKEKVVSFILNTKDIFVYFNDRYTIGIPPKMIEKRCCKSLIRNMASFDKEDFKAVYLNGIKRYPSCVFDLKLLVIMFLRLIFNRKC